jgi:hypothetical protein
LTTEAATALDAELRRRNLTESDRVEHQKFVKRQERRESGGFQLESAPMLRALKFCCALLLNFLFAVVGTAMLDTELRRAIPPYTITAIVWKEITLSVLCATFLGFSVGSLEWRGWRNTAAKWVWVLAVLWFVFGYLKITGNTNHFGPFNPLSSGSVLSGPDARTMTTFFAFTIPLIRAICYSVAAYISAVLHGARARFPDGC